MDKTNNYVLVKVLNDKRDNHSVTLLELFPNKFSDQFRLTRFEYYSDEDEARAAFKKMTTQKRAKEQNRK